MPATFAVEYMGRFSDAIEPPDPEDDSEDSIRYRMRARMRLLHHGPYLAHLEAEETDRLNGLNRERMSKGLPPLSAAELNALSRRGRFAPSVERAVYKSLEEPMVEELQRLAERWDQRTIHLGVPRFGKQQLLDEQADALEAEGKTVERVHRDVERSVAASIQSRANHDGNKTSYLRDAISRDVEKSRR